MFRKKLIFASLFALLSISLNSKCRNYEEAAKETFSSISYGLLLGLKHGVSPQKIQNGLEETSELLDKPMSATLLAKFKTKKEKEAAKEKHRSMNQLRKKNQSQENYKSTKENIKNILEACLKKNQKRECTELAKAYTHLLTSGKLGDYFSKKELESLIPNK